MRAECPAGAVFGASSAVMEISSAVPEAAADPAAVKAGRETSAGAGVYTPNECPTSGSQTASAGNRSGIPRLITKNGE